MFDEPILYHYWRSSCSWRVRWALAIKGIKFKSVPVDLLKSEQMLPDYRKKNPSGFLPCLVVNGKSFAESMAIIEWIEEKWAKNPLLPSELEARMKVRQLYMTISSGTQPLQNLAPQKFFSDEKQKQQEFARHWIIKGLAVYETILAEVQSGIYSFGDTATMADLCLIPQCYNAIRYEIDLSQFPRARKIYEHCLTTDTCKAAHPDNQDGAISG
jgi:maleylacetoacetate isomerase